MPPAISRSSLSFVARCKPCQLAPLSSRNFSTSAPRNAIGPENPRFIEVPTTLQRDAIPARDIKGTLPPPRNLFPSRGPDKVSEQYLSAVTREPSKSTEPPNEYAAWKRRMAASRRENLKEGLIELNKRKIRQEALVAQRSLAKRRANQARLKACQREDERLTNPTIKEAMSKLQVDFVPDPEREEEIAKKVLRVQAREAEKEAQRKDALHTLYMNARSFILTEEQLNAKIEEIFVISPFKHAPEKDNIWDARGAPPTVQDLLASVNHNEKTAVQSYAGPAAITGARMKRIAEELTGGKMD